MNCAAAAPVKSLLSLSDDGEKPFPLVRKIDEDWPPAKVYRVDGSLNVRPVLTKLISDAGALLPASATLRLLFD